MVSEIFQEILSSFSLAAIVVFFITTIFVLVPHSNSTTDSVDKQELYDRNNGNFRVIHDLGKERINSTEVFSGVLDELKGGEVDYVGGFEDSEIKEQESSFESDQLNKGRTQCGRLPHKEDPEEFDDWEGIERTELEKLFGLAVSFVDSNSNAINCLDNNERLQLYGLHKVATEGPCYEPRPMAIKLSARAKWNAWQRLRNMNMEMAMEQYIILLSKSIPEWKES